MEEFDGYEVGLLIQGGVGGEGSFCVTFQKPAKAMAWCVVVQERLLGVTWPDAILDHEAAGEVYTCAKDEKSCKFSTLPSPRKKIIKAT